MAKKEGDTRLVRRLEFLGPQGAVRFYAEATSTKGITFRKSDGSPILLLNREEALAIMNFTRGEILENGR